MLPKKKRHVRDELQTLPAIGPSLAADLRPLGVTSIASLALRDPERLYTRLCDITKSKQDPCVLYTFRCAVYAARTPLPDPELLKWWNWMERRFDDTGNIVATTKGAPEKYKRTPADVRRERARLRRRTNARA
ncbi:MAG TPA: helix-hairpin-helix domain-containing protein [Gemmatimonadaceae bacterium]|nr:helix-hairpin-helix domain-containing protein [Gemmatimonadaceae bacterium]